MAIIVDSKLEYNFNMKVLLNNLGAYHPFKAHTNIEIDQDLDVEFEHVATYVLMKDYSIITNIVATRRKRNTNSEFALVVDTREEPCKKIGSMGRKHAIVINVVALTGEITT